MVNVFHFFRSEFWSSESPKLINSPIEHQVGRLVAIRRVNFWAWKKSSFVIAYSTRKWSSIERLEREYPEGLGSTAFPTRQDLKSSPCNKRCSIHRLLHFVRLHHHVLFCRTKQSRLRWIETDSMPRQSKSPCAVGGSKHCHYHLRLFLRRTQGYRLQFQWRPATTGTAVLD